MSGLGPGSTGGKNAIGYRTGTHEEQQPLRHRQKHAGENADEHGAFRLAIALEEPDKGEGQVADRKDENEEAGNPDQKPREASVVHKAMPRRRRADGRQLPKPAFAPSPRLRSR